MICFRTKNELQPIFYTIQVFDEALRDLVRDNLGKTNVIRLHGKHQSSNKVAKKFVLQRHASYIRAMNIMITEPRADAAQSANDNAAVELE